MNQNQFNDISFLLINFKEYLYNVAKMILLFYSPKRSIKNIGKFLKNKTYNKWWIPMIDHLRVIVYIFTKKNDYYIQVYCWLFYQYSYFLLLLPNKTNKLIRQQNY